MGFLIGFQYRVVVPETQTSRQYLIDSVDFIYMMIHSFMYVTKMVKGEEGINLMGI